MANIPRLRFTQSGREVARYAADVGDTGWFTRSDGTRGYVIDGALVPRHAWLAYCTAHPERFGDPKWTEEPPAPRGAAGEDTSDG